MWFGGLFVYSGCGFGRFGGCVGSGDYGGCNDGSGRGATLKVKHLIVLHLKLFCDTDIVKYRAAITAKNILQPCLASTLLTLPLLE